MASVIRSLRYAYWLFSERITSPHFVLVQKPNALRLLCAQGKFGFVTFALDKNPVCSMVHGSKLTGEPVAKISLQGRSKIK